jgi:uncharacterized repeat protein (TIGR03843 family)
MAPARFSEEEFRESEARLRELPEIELLGVLRNASNYTFLSRLKPYGEDGLLAVYKPARGESPLWDFADGNLYRREVAAYLLSRALGWPGIPPTVIRSSAPHGVGALQLFIEADRRRHYFETAGEHSEEWQRVALFDVLTNNADRKSGHCLFDAAGRIWVIDHGLTFHVQPKLRTVIWEYAGCPLPQPVRADLERVVERLHDDLGTEVRELISRAELAALTRRMESALRPGWRYPEPGSGWSVPWPPI